MVVSASCSGTRGKGDLCILPKRSGGLWAFDEILRMQEGLDQPHDSFISDVTMTEMLLYYLMQSSRGFLERWAWSHTR